MSVGWELLLAVCYLGMLYIGVVLLFFLVATLIRCYLWENHCSGCSALRD